MSVRIRKVVLWRTELTHRPGALADLLEPLVAAGADLEVVMGYRIPGRRTRAVVEVAPIGTRRLARTAEASGLSTDGAPTLLVQGDNRPGLAGLIARALAESRVNIAFLVAQVVGNQYSAVFGFESEADLDKAADRIRAAVSPRRPRRRSSTRR